MPTLQVHALVYANKHSQWTYEADTMQGLKEIGPVLQSVPNVAIISDYKRMKRHSSSNNSMLRVIHKPEAAAI